MLSKRNHQNSCRQKVTAANEVLTVTWSTNPCVRNCGYAYPQELRKEALYCRMLDQQPNTFLCKGLTSTGFHIYDDNRTRKVHLLWLGIETRPSSAGALEEMSIFGVLLRSLFTESCHMPSKALKSWPSCCADD